MGAVKCPNFSPRKMSNSALQRDQFILLPMLVFLGHGEVLRFFFQLLTRGLARP